MRVGELTVKINAELTAEGIKQTMSRILELELEVKQLREHLYKIGNYDTLDGGKYSSHAAGWEGVAEFARRALSTPPPALAEAYVRLREAAYTVTHYESSNKMAAELAEIERLEK